MLRNQKPLMIDHSVGNGRVLFTMTALDRQWTNWPQDPTFVVAALKMVGYLSSFRGMDTSKVAGTPMRWDFSSQEMLPEVQVICPPLAGSTLRPILSINAATSGESSLAAVIDSSRSGETEESIRYPQCGCIRVVGNIDSGGSSCSEYGEKRIAVGRSI